MTDKNLTFRNELQGLRAIAIILVVSAHTGLTIFSGGFIGVDVFFVLSGYLITGLLLRELEETGHIDFMSFYARRLKRLFPALAFMLMVSFGLTIWLLSGVEARLQLASSPFAVAWISNLYFAFSHFDYFNELANKDVFLHTWSLGVEEQFYLIWPMLLLFLFWSAKKLVNFHNNTVNIMLFLLFMIFISSLILSLYWTIHSPQIAFYLMPSRIWQLSLGGIIYFICHYNILYKNDLSLNFSSLFRSIILTVGLILIITSAIFLHPNLAYPGLWALLPSLGTVLIISAVHTLPKDANGVLAYPFFIWLGDRSYSLYLWHWPIFTIGFSMGLQGQILPTLSMIALSIFLAIVSFRLIELPFWKGRWSHSKPHLVILTSLLIMAIMIFTMYHGLRQLPKAHTTTDISNQWRQDVPIIYTLPCDAWYAHARVEPCIFATETFTKTVVLVGDSIGVQWFSMIPEIFPEPLWRIIVLTKSSCPMVDEDYYYPRIGKIYQVCTDWRNAILNDLKALKPDVIIMGSSSTYGFSEDQWVEGTTRVLKRINNKETTVFVIPGTPNLGFNGPGCVSRHLSPEGYIDRKNCLAKDRMKKIEFVTQFLEKAVNQFSNMHLLNLNRLVCPENNCNAMNQHGMVVFRDSQHLTDSFVRSQVPFIREQFNHLYKNSN